MWVLETYFQVTGARNSEQIWKLELFHSISTASIELSTATLIPVTCDQNRTVILWLGITACFFVDSLVINSAL